MKEEEKYINLREETKVDQLDKPCWKYGSWRNGVLSIMVIAFIPFFIGYIAGAKLTHPVMYVNYVPTGNQMKSCIDKGGDYSLIKDKTNLTYQELCEVIEKTPIFTHILNQDYFDTTK